MISRYILDEETGENIKVYVKRDKATKEEIDAHENRKGIEILDSPKASIEEVKVEKTYLEETPKAEREPQ
jgi:hypothetical protein